MQTVHPYLFHSNEPLWHLSIYIICICLGCRRLERKYWPGSILMIRSLTLHIWNMCFLPWCWGFSVPLSLFLFKWAYWSIHLGNLCKHLRMSHISHFLCLRPHTKLLTAKCSESLPLDTQHECCYTVSLQFPGNHAHAVWRGREERGRREENVVGEDHFTKCTQPVCRASTSKPSTPLVANMCSDESFWSVCCVDIHQSGHSSH